MSDIQDVMKFEYLPNEILIECFEYLNGFEIFYSFGQLNNRFNILIENIPLNINFQDINKSVFDQFRTKMLLNPKIKNQIYSFKISDKDQCFLAKILLSSIPINELSGLEKFELIIPIQFSELISFLEEGHDSEFYLNIKLTDLLQCKLHTLSIPLIHSSVLDSQKPSSIINLTISQCNLHDMYCILKHFSMLKYLHVGHMKYIHFYNTDIYSNDQYGIRLKQLIIDEYNDEFINFQKFIKQTPNLKNLTISNSIHKDMINAYQWENLITSFLPYLKIFKFKFTHSLRRQCQDTVIDQFKQFQTDFWQKQHHWYTEYVIQERNAIVYTPPYPLTTYTLEQSGTRYSNNLVNNINTFTNVTHLDIYPSVFSENNAYYFPNITTITLYVWRYGSLLTTEYIEYLKTILNRCNVKCLETINKLVIKNPLDLFELLKLTPNLSTLIMNSKSLQSCFKNDELCKSFNKMITNLQIHDSNVSHWKDIKINQFCEIFSNLEHLKCCIDDENNLLFLIEHLPKLSTLKATYRGNVDPETKLNRFKKEAEKFNLIFDIERTLIETDTDEEDSKDFYRAITSIWIDKNRV